MSAPRRSPGRVSQRYLVDGATDDRLRATAHALELDAPGRLLDLLATIGPASVRALLMQRIDFETVGDVVEGLLVVRILAREDASAKAEREISRLRALVAQVADASRRLALASVSGVGAGERVNALAPTVAALLADAARDGRGPIAERCPDCEDGNEVVDHCATCEGPIYETCTRCKGTGRTS